MRLYETSLYLGLVHYPVVNKNGETIASALTNFDLHDIARAACTFGVKGFYCITPLKDQQEIARAIARHWQTGFGSAYNPKRQQALHLISVCDAIADAVADITVRAGLKPKVVATSAQHMPGCCSFNALKESLAVDAPHLLLFGTAWGLGPEVFDNADCILEPIEGAPGYNHLSVRAAASIMLDRLDRA